MEWKIVAGGKTIAKGEATERTIAWPDNLPPGVHRAFLTDATSLIEEVPVIVAPQRAFAGDFDRGWLLAIQLYGIRSVRNWGMGDFTDLEHLIELARDLGPTASASIRCTHCSTTGPAIAARTRRTAGCFSTRSISTSKKFPSFHPAP